MVDLETLLQPVLEDVPDPKPFDAVRARAAVMRRRRRTRRAAIALAVVLLIGVGSTVALRLHDRHTVVTVVGPSGPTPTLGVGPPSTFTHTAMDMLAAYGSIWVSQRDRVARLDPRTGRVEATIPVPGTSDYRNLAAGADAIWVDDTGAATLTRIDPARNTVTKVLSMNANPLVIDGLAFVDGKLWVARPEPEDDSRGDVIAIDPATNRIAQRVTIPRTFGVMSAGDHSLWYVRGSDLLRFDTRSLDVTTVRHDTISVLTAASEYLWVLTSEGVLQLDPTTGAQIGPPMVPPGPVNVVAAVGSGVVWLGAQSESTTPGSIAPYDIATGRRLAPPTRLASYPPVVAATALDDALWVASVGGLTRIPFHS